MKILMVNTEKDRGGAARMAQTLVYAVNQSGNAEALLAHCGDTEITPAFKGFKQQYVLYANVIQTRLRGSHCLYDFGFAERLLDMAKEADVVHIHNVHGYYLDYVKFIKGLGNKPIVWTWHDMWGVTGRCGFSMDCDGWQTGCLHCDFMDYYPSAWLDNAASEFAVKSDVFKSNKSIRIVSPSDWLADIAVQGGYDCKRVQTIPNPVDLTQYTGVDQQRARTAHGLPDEPLLLFVAHDCEDKRKRYVDFEKVVLELEITGVVVGVPPKNMHPKLIYLGELKDAEELANAYAAADAFIITSQTDNYPNTVIESMACGTPVFGYAVGGIPSQMPGEWDGLVDYLDIAGLVKNIRFYFDNPEHFKGLSKILQAHSRESWNPAVVAQKYIAVYEKALGRHG